MEDELKALRVTDLRAILSKAHVQVSSKTNKTDLIAKIISSKQAIDVYKSIYNKSDDLLAPPEDDDWDNEQEPSVTTSPPPPPPTAAEPPTAPATVTNGVADAKGDEDPEAEKRRKRAERFGIPLVEPPKPRPLAPKTRSPHDDLNKLESRAARFGITATAHKRSAPTDTVDAEEQEKRRRRAERFGVTPTGAKA